MPLPARERLQVPLGQRLRADGRERGVCRRIVRLGIAPGIPEVGEAPVQHEPARRQVRNGPGLRQEGELARHGLVRKAGKGFAVQQDLALARLEQAAGRAQQRRLAAAVRPDQRGEAPVRQGEAEIAQHRLARVADGEVPQLKHGRAPPSAG